DSAVWYKLMEPRLRKLVKEQDQRLDILQQVYCETHRSGEARLPPGQVMPLWPEKLGMHRYELVHVAPNTRMGGAILRYYMGHERFDVRKALARYNGSPGQRNYPDMVISQWAHWGGADDLGFPKIKVTPLR